LGREELREALFDVVEQLTSHPLGDSGKKLVLHYFNDSKETTAFAKAIAAANKYYPESIPAREERSVLLNKLIERLYDEAEAWDAEAD
jgi:hypothetical protein